MKTFTEKRFFEWHEDEISVSLRAKSGSYGGGSEVFVLESNQNHATINDTEVCPCLPASMGMGGGYVPMIVDVLPFDTTQITSDKNWSHPRYGDPCHPLANGQHPSTVVISNDKEAE